MAIRRLPLILLLAAALAGCSSGSSNVAGPAKSTSSTVTGSTSATTSPTPSSTTSKVSGGGATDFCAAFTELKNASGATTPATAGAAFRAAAADMRAHAPAAIKDAVGTYADLMDTIGKAAQSGSMGEQDMQKAVADGIAGKSADIATVAVWVGKNCQP